MANNNKTGIYQQQRKNLKPNFESLVYGKIPPQAIELEEAVLGAILLEKWCLNNVLEIIQSHECFYVDANQKVYKAIQATVAAGYPVDLLTVTDTLRKAGELDLVGGAQYLTQLTMSVVSSAHVEGHARIVMEKHMAREQIRIGASMVNRGYDDKVDIFDSLEEAEGDLFQLAHSNAKQEVMQVSDIIMEVQEEMEIKRHQRSVITGLTTGFHKLDLMTSGLQRDKLYILAARPAVGKTAFALAMSKACMFSHEHGGAVAFFTLEMSRSELIHRLIAEQAEVELDRVNNPFLRSSDDESKIQAAMLKLAGARFHIDDTGGLTMPELRGKARRLKAKHDVKMIVIDYLQLMTGDTNKSTNREQEISKISRELKLLAKELHIPIVALSQLSRDIEKRADNTPKLSDLRESGAIEQDADVVMMLYRPTAAEQAQDPMLANTGQVAILKNRSGACDTIILQADMRIQRWADRPAAAFTGGKTPPAQKQKPQPPVEQPLEVNTNLNNRPGLAAPDDLPF